MVSEKVLVECSLETLASSTRFFVYCHSMMEKVYANILIYVFGNCLMFVVILLLTCQTLRMYARKKKLKKCFYIKSKIFKCDLYL